MFCFNVLAGIFCLLLGRLGVEGIGKEWNTVNGTLFLLSFLRTRTKATVVRIEPILALESILQKKNLNYLSQLGELNNIIPSNFQKHYLKNLKA